MLWCSAQLRARRPDGVAKLGAVDQQIQDDAGKPQVQDAVINVSAAYKDGIIWHSTEVNGGSGVPYEKPGDGELIPVRTILRGTHALHRLRQPTTHTASLQHPPMHATQTAHLTT